MTYSRERLNRTKSDRGFTLAELLVAVVIMSAVIAVGVSLLSSTFRVAASTQTRGDLWNSMTNSSVQLIRDVNDGSKVTISEPRHLAVQVVRDGKCQTRDWLVDGDQLISTTTFYDAPSCTGGSTERRVVSIKSGLNGFTFTYYSSASIDTPLPVPVSPGVVNRVGWSMQATPADTTAVLRLESGAAFTGRGVSTDGTGAEQTPLSAFLSVVTHETGIPGVDPPVLSWTDATPELTQGWAVYRTSYPDGADAASSTGWEQVAFLRTATPAPGTMTYTDRTLPRGYTGLYVVRATVPDGYGPSSNQQATGLRPSPSTLTTTGTPSSIELSWTAPRGATAYDIYRTETSSPTPILYRTWDDTKGSAKRSGTGDALRWTWSDPLAAGHAHTYSVVPVNRWERLATTSSQTGSLPTGEALARAYSGTTATTRTAPRASSPLSGAFTAPARPERPLLDLSSRTSATDYGSTVAWTPAPWVGGGPEVATDGQGHRDRGWAAERRGSVWEPVWAAETPHATTVRTDAGTAPDLTYGYRLRTVNGSGASAWSAEKSILQRPAVPAAPSAVLSGLTTRQATVTAKTSSSATSWQIQKLSGPGSASMGGIKATNGSRQVVYAELGHNAAHTWQTRSTNVAPTDVAGGGTSAWGATGGVTTAELRVWLSDGSSTTRSVSARLNNMGGNDANLTVEGFQTQPSSGGGQTHTFGEGAPGLSHNTSFTLTARLTDGYNSVAYQDRIATRELPAPQLGFDSHTTQSIRAWVDCGIAPGCSVIGPDGQELGSGTTWSRLSHNQGHSFRGHSSDGWNHRYVDGQARTLELTVATPTCSVSRDGPYAPTTVRWSSSGSLSRSSVYAGSPGWYEAMATSTRSDGWNTVQRESRCGTTVAQRPYVVGGASGGTPSPTCAPHTGRGDVRDLLSRAVNGAAVIIGSPKSGSYNADYGSLVTSTPMLSCAFYRNHYTVDSDGIISGEYNLGVRWTLGGSGAS